MEKQFNITWCQNQSEIPAVGTVCSKCGTGELRQSKYYDGVYCSNKACGWSWRPSKFVKQQEKQPISQNGNQMLMEEILTLNTLMAETNFRLDKLIAYVVKNIPEVK